MSISKTQFTQSGYFIKTKFHKQAISATLSHTNFKYTRIDHFFSLSSVLFPIDLTTNHTWLYSDLIPILLSIVANQRKINNGFKKTHSMISMALYRGILGITSWYRLLHREGGRKILYGRWRIYIQKERGEDALGICVLSLSESRKVYKLVCFFFYIVVRIFVTDNDL